jgi:hypothetical protein
MVPAVEHDIHNPPGLLLIGRKQLIMLVDDIFKFIISFAENSADGLGIVIFRAE